MYFYAFISQTVGVFLAFGSRLLDFQQAQFFFVFCLVANAIINHLYFSNQIKRLLKHNTLLAESIEYFIYNTESKLNTILNVATEKVENLDSFDNTQSLDYLKKKNKALEEKIIELTDAKKRRKKKITYGF